MNDELTEAAVLAAVAALGDISDEQRNSVVCALIGHSDIQSSFFGYYNCGRCNEQVGDALGGSYSSASVVIIGHNCDRCRANFEALTWRDKLFAPDPFKAEEVTP